MQYAFDDLVMDIGARRLLRHGEPVPLSKLSFDCLRVLVEAAPNLVSHATLAREAWGPQRVVSPENLNQRLLLLRQALGDEVTRPRYVESVRGQGYRLIPEATPLPAKPAARASPSRLKTPQLAEVIPRKPLQKTLAGHCERGRHVWLFAPPGAGKTTLAASFVDRLGYASLWFQLAGTESEAAVFFYHLTRAAEYVASGIGRALPQLTPEHDDLPAFSSRYFDALFAGLPEHCVLVLDDYQQLHADSSVHDAVASALTLAGRRQYVLVASRQPPPPQLARARVNQRLSVVDWNDIRFSPEECSVLLLSRGIRDRALIQQITTAANGWAAGLVLMLEIGRPLRLSEPPDPDHQVMFDYFAVEVADIVLTHHIELLACASLFDYFNPRMVAMLSGDDEQTVHTLVSDLYSRQFFIHRHAQAPDLFQFHPLFRQFLLAEAGRRHSGEQLGTLKHRAAEIARDSGRLENAVALFIDTEQWHELATVCVEHAEELLRSGRHKTLLRWIESLPREEREKSSPWLSLYHGCAQLPYEPLAAQNMLGTAYVAFKAQGDVEGRFSAWALAVEGLNLSWHSFDSAPFWLEELEELLAVATYPSQEVECRISFALLSLLIWSEAGTRRFPDLVGRCEELLRQIDEPSITASLASGLLYFHMAVSGNCRAADELIDVANERIIVSEAQPLTKTLWYTMCLTHCATTGKQGFAEGELRNVWRLIDSSGVRVLEAVALGNTAMLYVNLGDDEQAEALLKRMALRLTRNRRIVESLYTYVSACRYLQLEKYEAASSLVEEGFQVAEETCVAMVQGLFAWVGFHSCLALQQDEKCRFYRDHMNRIVDKGGSNAFRYQLLLMDAQLARRESDLETAKAALARALCFARAHGIRSWGATKPLGSIFAFALEHGLEQDYVKECVSRLRIRLEAVPGPGIGRPLPGSDVLD